MGRAKTRKSNKIGPARTFYHSVVTKFTTYYKEGRSLSENNKKADKRIQEEIRMSTLSREKNDLF